MEQDLGELEGVVQVTGSYQRQRGEHGDTSFPPPRRVSQLVEDVTRLVQQVAADDLVGADVDQIPVVDAVGASQVELAELLASVVGGLAAGGLLAHDAEPTGPCLVDRAGQQLVDLVGWQVDELLGQPEHLAHAHADELLSCAVGALVGGEVAPDSLASTGEESACSLARNASAVGS